MFTLDVVLANRLKKQISARWISFKICRWYSQYNVTTAFEVSMKHKNIRKTHKNEIKIVVFHRIQNHEDVEDRLKKYKIEISPRDQIGTQPRPVSTTSGRHRVTRTSCQR